MFRNIRGVITFKAEGISLEALLNDIHQNNIVCFNLNIKNGCLTGEIYRKNIKDIIKLGEKNSMNVDIIKKHGLIFKLLPYKKRYGIILGIILSFVFIIFLSNIVLRIEIDGNIRIPGETILSQLKDNGIYSGKFIPDLNYQQIERKILLANKDISFISIRNIGGRITVEVDEVVNHEDIVPSNIPCNIIATEDAQIVSAKAHNGILLVEKNDVVTKGSLLISGIYTTKHGKSVVLHSTGEVIGRYIKTETFEQKLTEETKTQENMYTKKRLKIFSFTIGKDIEFDETDCYEYSEDMKYINFLGMKLPIGFLHENYITYKTEEVNYPEEIAEKLLYDKVDAYEQNFFDDVKIVSKTQNMYMQNQTKFIAIQYELEGDITKNQRIVFNN